MGSILACRLSPERMQFRTGEMVDLVGQLMAEGNLDYIDMSLWDCFKEAEEDEFKGKTLTELFAGLDRGNTKLGVAGQIRSGTSAQRALDEGADFVLIGRAAIPEHDFPERVRRDPAHEMPPPPFTREHLLSEGVSPPFLTYLDVFAFVEKQEA